MDPSVPCSGVAHATGANTLNDGKPPKRADLLAIADSGITIAGDVRHCAVDHDVLQSLHRAAREKMHEYSVSTDAPRLTSGVRVVPLIHGEGGYFASRKEIFVDSAPGTRLRQIQLGWSRLRAVQAKAAYRVICTAVPVGTVPPADLADVQDVS
eukprot:5827385-Amphidinium_carterae.1